MTIEIQERAHNLVSVDLIGNGRNETELEFKEAKAIADLVMMYPEAKAKQSGYGGCINADGQTVDPKLAEAMIQRTLASIEQRDKPR